MAQMVWLSAELIVTFTLILLSLQTEQLNLQWNLFFRASEAPSGGELQVRRPSAQLKLFLSKNVPITGGSCYDCDVHSFYTKSGTVAVFLFSERKCVMVPLICDPDDTESSAQRIPSEETVHRHRHLLLDKRRLFSASLDEMMETFLAAD